MPRVTRRDALEALIAAAGAGATLGAEPDSALAAAGDSSWAADPSEVLRLWPGAPPGSDAVEVREEVVERPNPAGLRDRIVRSVREPRITVFRPRGRPRGALLLLPGGGYRHVVVDKEGFETARWLAERGIAVFVLFYRLPADGWSAGPDAPLQDAQRAMRLLRSRASTWGLDAQRLGVVGFSAGGHLAARLACSFTRPTYAAVDAADDLSARPALAGLMYPVITMESPMAHAGSREQMLGPTPSAELVREYSAETAVGPDAPPAFILHAGDDASVPVENSERMSRALRAAGVPVDLHVFAIGGHGFGLRAVAGKPVAVWPQLFLDWLDWQFTHGADART